ncbi:MAG: AAA family ATPase [Candidatus Peribacteraceae bacterium]|nr:AAA family ATPase [Candidatus Peribacteraceae bacterium]
MLEPKWVYEDEDKTKGFKVRWPEPDVEERKEDIKTRFIFITSDMLLSAITSVTRDTTWRYNGREWKHIAIFPTLLKKLREFSNEHLDEENQKIVEEFSNYIVQVFPFDKILKESKETGYIPAFLYPFHIEEGKDIFWTTDEGQLRGGQVLSVEERSSFFEGSYFEVRVKYIHHDSDQFCYSSEKIRVPLWEGGKRFSDLKVQLMEDEVREELTERGSLYKKVTEKAAYVQYEGDLSRKTYWQVLHFKSTGRIMVDRANMEKLDSDYFDRYDDNDDEDNGIASLPEDLYWMCDSKVYGFSFSIKKWGEFQISNISEIKFDKEAFSQLVLEEEKKNMILALVKNYHSGFSDIISGKGGGCIFLLHGAPGCGKTLTAEAVAEELERPLYSVTIGELGIDPDQLEERLRQVLEMAEIWNAVLLLDEADIFMEERNESDVHRNAMVGIFLRLLEYHQGVLFLTTNRAKNIDKAMRSRISIPLFYEDHGENSRTMIWDNLIEAAGLDSSLIDVEHLASKDLNGRQIKSTIRMAQAMAAESGDDVNTDYLMSYIGLLDKFEKQMNKKD